MSCQNLESLKSRVLKLFENDLDSPFSADEWRALVQGFQKRHLIAHRMGVIDQAYIDATGDLGAVVGRKVYLDSVEVAHLLLLIRRIGRHIRNFLRAERATKV